MNSGGENRLCEANIRAANGAADMPDYDRKAITAGIVHLGVGAFHRAHQAAYIDDCLADGQSEWGIVGASLRSADTRDALAPQDGLYTLAVQSAAGEKLRVIGSIISLLVAPENPDELIARMADPATRIVTLTVTEKAYLRGADGDLDSAHPDIQWDIANADRPRTVYGFLAAALERRQAAGVPAFTVLCCDNLPANGATVRRFFLQFMALRGAGALQAMRDVAFPSTMIDRIVPATTEADRARISKAIGLVDAWPVKAEPFMQWVVEDNFPLGRPDWERFGVTMVDDVGPFEDMKLRLLNGAHSAIAYFGLLTGGASVSEAFGNPLIRRFIQGLWDEAIPTLPANSGLKPDGYVGALAERFSNPALIHRTAQIANDGSQKLPQRILATAAARLRAGESAGHLLATVAAWIACCQSRGAALPAKHFTDPLDAQLAAIFLRNLSEDEMVREIFECAGFGGDEAQIKAVAAYLEVIIREGAETALKAAGGERVEE